MVYKQNSSKYYLGSLIYLLVTHSQLSFCGLISDALDPSPLVSSSNLNDADSCLVTAPAGTFQGFVKNAVLEPHVPFCNFLGIQYGEAPIGDKRFAEPVPAKPLKGVQLAATEGSFCAQSVRGLLLGSEDCLFLNVFKPKKQCSSNQHSLMPVIVYIHGSFLQIFSSTPLLFSPDHLMEHDVMVVTFNHRLGPFGFLSLGIPDCGGNMALKDISLVLQWVNKNIESFGGDPCHVTIMGDSAGAWLAYLEALSPKNQGLFDKVILQSPTTRSIVRNITEPNSLLFAGHMKYQGDLQNREDVLRYLRQLCTDEMLIGFQTFGDYLYQNDVTYVSVGTPFYPIIDGYLHEKAFLPHCLEILGKNLSKHIAVLIGQTSADGTVFSFPRNIRDVVGQNSSDSTSFRRGGTQPNFIDEIIGQPDFAGHLLLSSDIPSFISRLEENIGDFLDPDFTKNTTKKEEIVSEVHKFYFEESKETLVTNALWLYADLEYMQAEEHYYRNQITFFNASYHCGNIYNYQYSYQGSLQFLKFLFAGAKAFPEINGAGHADDISATFYSIAFYPVYLPNETDKEVIRLYSKTFSNFVKRGNPNSVDDCPAEIWKPIGPNEMSFFRFDAKSEVVNGRINEDRCRFWDKLAASLDECM